MLAQTNQFNGIDKIIPVSFNLTRSGTYQPQRLRSWEVSGSMHDLTTLTKHIERLSCTSIDPTLIASVAPSLVQVSASVQGDVPIVNGWNNQHGVFVLMLDVCYKVGNVVRWIVQGYTDEPAFTNQHVAPNMVFYINNIFSMAPQRVVHQGNQMTGMSMVDNFQMINGFSGSQVPGGHQLIRPQDVMSNIATADLLGSIGNVIDTTTLASTQPQSSRHRNNLGASVLADTFNVWHQASCDEHASTTSGHIAEKAYGMLVETDPSMDTFMALLVQANNSLGHSTVNFTFDQLVRAVPRVMEVYMAIEASGTTGLQYSNAGQSEHFDGQNQITHIAVNLQTAIPAIMVECLLASVSFTMTNDQPGGALVIKPSHVGAFSRDMDMRQWSIFKNRIEREILPLVRTPGSTFFLNVISNFFHEVQIDLRIGLEEVRFVSPAFCNSILTPVQTASNTHASNFSQEMLTMSNLINDALMESTVKRSSRIENLNPSPGSIQPGFILPQPAALSIPNYEPSIAAPAGTGMRSGMGYGAQAQPAQPYVPPVVAPAAQGGYTGGMRSGRR